MVYSRAVRALALKLVVDHGLSDLSVHHLIGVPRCTVTKWRLDYGATPNKSEWADWPGWQKEAYKEAHRQYDWQQIAVLARRGMTAADIAARTRVPEWTVRRAVDLQGLVLASARDQIVPAHCLCGRAELLPRSKNPSKWRCERCKAMTKMVNDKMSRRRQRYAAIKTEVRTFVLERDKWVCQLCLNSIPKGLTNIAHDLYPQIDHIVPRARGGSNEEDNLQAAHNFCNRAKRDQDDYLFKQEWRRIHAKRQTPEASRTP